MNSKENLIHPRARIIIFLFSILWIFISATLEHQFVGYCILIAFLVISRQIKSHFKIVLTAGLPLLLMLFFVYGYLLNGSTTKIGIEFALSIFIRIGSMMALFQFSLALSSVELMDLLTFSRLNIYLKLIILESYSSLKELTIKVDRIMTARYSRGFVKKRNYFQTIIQLPFVLRPLFSSMLSGTFEKAANWKQLRLIEEFGVWSVKKQLFHSYSHINSWILTLLIILWTLFVICSKFNLAL